MLFIETLHMSIPRASNVTESITKREGVPRSGRVENAGTGARGGGETCSTVIQSACRTNTETLKKNGLSRKKKEESREDVRSY